MTKQVPVCRHCASKHVLFDSYAEWDADTEKYVVHSVFDKGAYCHECDGEAKIQWVWETTND